MQQDNDRKHSGKKNLAVAEAQSHTQPDVKRDVQTSLVWSDAKVIQKTVT